MALTSQLATHCNECDGNHLPDDPHVPRSRNRGGGRHLAPKKTRTPVRPPRQAGPRGPAAARPKIAARVKGPLVPSAEELGTATAQLLRKLPGRIGGVVRGTVGACRQWWLETRRGLRDLIDVESLMAGAEESRHADKTKRLKGPLRSKHVAGPVLGSRPADVPTATRAGTGSTMELVETGAASRDHLLEVSVLESLGFFDPATEVVVTMGSPPDSYPPGASPQSPAGPGSGPPGVRRQLIPDIDLTSWKPHVIARSKLGRGRFSTTMIAVLLISLLTLAVMVTNLLRAPAEVAARQEDALVEASTQLGLALARLEPVLASASTDVAEATSILISVDTAARDLFDAAALLGGDTQEQVLRQSAASLAQRSLALESSVGDALNYRLVLSPLWASPELSGIVDPTQAAAAIAAWQPRLADMVESLPSSVELGVHVDQVRGFVEGLEAWRLRYLDALSIADVASAEAAVADLDGQLALLAQSGEDILSGVFETASAERSRILSGLASLSGDTGISG